MANYTAEQMNAGALGEVLNAGQQYEFTLTTPTYTSQSVYFDAAYFVVDSSTFTNANLTPPSTIITGSFGGVGMTGIILSGLNLTGSATGGTGGTVATLLNQAPSSQTGGGSLATFDLVVDLSGGVIAPAVTLGGALTGGDDGTPGAYTGVATTSDGDGVGLTLDVTTLTTGVFKAAQSFDTFSAVTATIDGVTGPIATTSPTGVGATVVITSLAGVVSQVVISAQGSGYVVAEALTVSQAAMDADGGIGTVDAGLVITIAPKDLGSSVQTVISSAGGTLYDVGDVITVQKELIGDTTTNLTLPVVTADLTPTLASIAIGDNNGSGYDVGDQLTFSGAASPGGATAVVLTLIDQYFTSGPTLGWVISNSGFAFSLPQNVGAEVVAFNFTPTTLIPVNSYLLKSTGHATLNIT